MTSCCSTDTPVTAKKHSEQQAAISQGKNASSDKLLEETGFYDVKLIYFGPFYPLLLASPNTIRRNPA
jgi:hypothetical protein